MIAISVGGSRLRKSHMERSVAREIMRKSSLAPSCLFEQLECVTRGRHPIESVWRRHLRKETALVTRG